MKISSPTIYLTVLEEVPMPEEEKKSAIGEPKTDMDSLTKEEQGEVAKLFEMKKKLFVGSLKELIQTNNNKEGTKNNNLVEIRELRTDSQNYEDKVMRVLTTDTTIVSCDGSGGLCRRENQELVISDKRYCDANELTDGRPDANGGGLGCHENRGTITDDPPDKGKMENEMKRGTVVINVRKFRILRYEKWW
ncbi:14042_t:CDS:2 [Acaulospora morrowiae]|uniref:14042_t:CDS:1 n=1 Tax=Acaulospora morrowiae TaxID=94023 RepID=A0A9N9ANA1_9GLOM|nr:14042_t:CDS:2 [Acaulospora morrowiae]